MPDRPCPRAAADAQGLGERCGTQPRRRRAASEAQPTAASEEAIVLVWLIASTWVVLYVSNHCLTIWATRLHQAHARDHFDLEGSYELNPVLQADVDRLRLVSPRFIVSLLLSATSIVGMWFLTASFLGTSVLFDVYAGTLVLPCLAMNVRHVRNLVLFTAIKVPGTIRGKIAYSRWIQWKLTAVDFLGFAGLFLVLGLLLKDWFLLGGTLSCAAHARQYWALMKKSRPRVAPAAEECA